MVTDGKMTSQVVADMSLREWLAGMAISDLAGYVPMGDKDKDAVTYSARDIAMRAVHIADAVIAELSRDA